MRPFTFLLIGQAISLLGSVLTGFALAVWAYQQSGESAMVYAAIAVANGLPIFLLGPIAGAAADRWNRKHIILASQFAAISMTAALTVLYYTETLAVWHIITLVALNSVFTAFVLPTIAATVPLMVPKGFLTRANGCIALAFGLIELASPLLSGSLYQAFGLMPIFIIDIVTFSIGIATIMLIGIPQPPSSTEAGKELAKESFWQSMLHGFAYLRDTKPMLELIIFFCVVASAIRAISLMVQPMILGFTDAQALGQVMTIAGSGALLGSILLIPFRDMQRHIPIIFATTAVIAVAAILTPITTNILFLAIGGFFLMACFPILDTHCRTLFQRKIDPALLGRIIGARNFVLGIFQTSTILACGWLADAVFEPAMQNQLSFAKPMIDLFGSGSGRGIAVLISLMGLSLVAILLIAMRRKNLRCIDSILQDIDIPCQFEQHQEDAEELTQNTLSETSVESAPNDADLVSLAANASETILNSDDDKDGRNGADREFAHSHTATA
ncbi:MAG: MFS transporter [Pseudomonadales bacterium]|nr:MFS transporter [Pseudomonadales bacterium]